MARYILWFAVIVIFATGLFTKGETLSLFSRIVMWGSLGILALCESIEKLNPNK